MILKSAIIADKQYIQTTCREHIPDRGALRVVEAKIRNLKSFHVTRRHAKLTTRRSDKEHQRVNERHQQFDSNTRVNGEATVRHLSCLPPWLIHKSDQKDTLNRRWEFCITHDCKSRV